MNPKSNNSFLFLSIIVIVLGLLATTARAEERGKCVASATFAKKATKKTPVEPTTTKPSKQTVTAITITYEGARKPVSFDRQGAATYHEDMIPVMKAVDLSTVPADAAIATKREASVEGHVVMRLLAFTPTGNDE